MAYRKPTKAKQAEGIRMIEGAFIVLGAERKPSNGEYDDREWTLATKAGPLTLKAVDCEFIHCRFEDVEKAKDHLGHSPNSRLNPYSGKWNWHFDHLFIEVNLAQFGREVRSLLE